MLPGGGGAKAGRPSAQVTSSSQSRAGRQTNSDARAHTPLDSLELPGRLTRRLVPDREEAGEPARTQGEPA